MTFKSFLTVLVGLCSFSFVQGKVETEHRDFELTKELEFVVNIDTEGFPEDVEASPTTTYDF